MNQIDATLNAQSSHRPLHPAAGLLIEPSRLMKSDGFDWDHEIRIALPATYHETDKSYPVLWVTDGSWAFDQALQAYASVRKHIPEMIIIGIGEPLEAAGDHAMRRLYEFTPTETHGFESFGSDLLKREWKAIDEQISAMGMTAIGPGGGAGKFLSFLVDTIRPALAGDYRMADEHVLFGDSAGGLFCAYALLARPEAFGRYICGSPALHYVELFHMEERHAQAHRDLPAKVFFGAGEAEIFEGGLISGSGIVSSMVRMVELLKLRNYPSLELHVRIFPGEDHGSVIPMNLSWGLRTLWNAET